MGGPIAGGRPPDRQQPPEVPLHDLPSEHMVPGATHRSVPALQQSLFGETPRQGEPVAQHGSIVCPHDWQLPL